MTRLLAVLILWAVPAWAGAQEFDDPAVTVCELLVRPEYEIEQNVYRRVSASVIGAKAILDFEWAVNGAKPNAVHVECPYSISDDKWTLDFPSDHEAEILGRPGYLSISASGLYPIPRAETALR